jgi:hypothetical protein
MFRRGCEARRKYFSALPLGGPLCSGGDLNPVLGFCFPLFSMSFAREFPSGWKSVERSGIKIVVFLSSNYLQSFHVFWQLSAFSRESEESQCKAVSSSGNCLIADSRPIALGRPKYWTRTLAGQFPGVGYWPWDAGLWL